MSGETDMAQDFAAHFYKSTAWLKTRRNYLNLVLDTSGEALESQIEDGKLVYRRRDGSIVPPESVVPPGVCERCFAMGKLTLSKVVHHKIHLTPQSINCPSVTLNPDNLQRLCQDCHAAVHGNRADDRVAFADDGSIVPTKESFQSIVMRLTETVDERRNIHKEGKD